MFTPNVRGIFCRIFVAFAALLVVAGTAAAQPTTFIVGFSRTGTPEFDAAGANIGGAFVNPCTNENVNVTGTTTITMTQSADNNGTIKSTVSAVTRGTGTGWSVDASGNVVPGASYSFSESQQFMVKQEGLTLAESDFSDKLSMKGAKSVDNWVLRVYFRIKIDPVTGAVLADITRINADACKG